MAEVVCVGIVVADALGMPIDTYPEKGKLTLFDHLGLHVGGCAANTAIALAKLGVDAMIAAKVGDDILGKFVTEEIKGGGVDVAGIKLTDRTSTSFTFVMVGSDGERAFCHTIGANAHLALDDISLEDVKQARVLHIGGSLVMPALDGEPTAALLKLARDNAVITSVDTAYNDRLGDWLAVIKPSLPYIDYFLPSLLEARRISGLQDPREVARFFRDNGCRVVGLKMGLQGSYVLSDDEEAELPIYRVETVDTTGAGDCWVGGFLAGVLRGWRLEECARLGNAVAALNCQVVGASAGVKGFDEVRAFQARLRKQSSGSH